MQEDLMEKIAKGTKFVSSYNEEKATQETLEQLRQQETERLKYGLSPFFSDGEKLLGHIWDSENRQWVLCSLPEKAKKKIGWWNRFNVWLGRIVRKKITRKIRIPIYNREIYDDYSIYYSHRKSYAMFDSSTYNCYYSVYKGKDIIEQKLLLRTYLSPHDMIEVRISYREAGHKRQIVYRKLWRGQYNSNETVEQYQERVVSESIKCCVKLERAIKKYKQDFQRMHDTAKSIAKNIEKRREK